MNQGRPKEFDTDRALELATQQFWKVGYSATSLQDLLKVMRLSKSSLYQTFGSKQQLFIQCLNHYEQSMASRLEQKLVESDSAVGFLREFLEEIVAEAAARGPRKGCLLVNTANELSQRDPQIKVVVSDGANHFIAIFRRAIELAVERGEMLAPASISSLASFYFSGVSGLRTMVKAGVSQEELHPVVNLIMEKFN
ncbi:TetR/AcrR family transcriptional regulator [Porticoccus litoralis]|uniref:TetR/AcrR family transcriptional regulator n=1 Tax=Porticoccus litoralis TaxID=434086 RepID=A0AAW8B8R4_9GAMM|nr:TetR/AcrR family transcriptional regulator [Porticoccus litoralis]MDP1521471.1 TetR/AcrR family transcriptional regulator [Porticoccus litoralis]